MGLKGGEFHKRGAAAEKALDLVSINLASLIDGTVSKASPAEHSAWVDW